MAALIGGGLRASPARSRSRITACCSSTNCRSSSRRCSIRCASPWRTARSRDRRANHRVTYPARFMLVAAMNPCRCGQATEPGYSCPRAPNDRRRQYQARISGPLIDRIDLRIEVPAVTAADLILPPPAEGSAAKSPRGSRRARHPARRYAAAGCRGSAPTPTPGLGAGRDREPDAPAQLLRDAADAMRLSARAITACCGSPAPSPISTAPKRSTGCIWPRRCRTAAQAGGGGGGREGGSALPAV